MADGVLHTRLYDPQKISRKISCLECNAPFIPSAGRRVFCSDRCRDTFERFDADRCFYCGEPGTTAEHITPQSVSFVGETVRACHQCNSICQDLYPYNLIKRMEFLRSRLRKKNKLHRSYIFWSDEELLEMSDQMRRKIKADERRRLISERRDEHLAARINTVKAAVYDALEDVVPDLRARGCDFCSVATAKETA